ncbi:deoxyribose-phosphate aldolase [Candidatus Bathyarchaeota archaeon]|nr:deoxyribose-phosphate aldolase [Candidatus Bathyarchaeota archaeon]
MPIRRDELARMIDSTLLEATATKKDIERLCCEALEYSFRCVVVNPAYVRLAASILKDSEVKVCSTVSFPLGATLPEIKALEAIKAIENGAEELDMVINLGALKSGDYELVKRDIEAVVAVKRLFREVIVKVIIETPLLTNEEKKIACRLATEAGADFVKTSTGFFGKGATAEDVKLLRRTIGEAMGVKAAGGIRTYADATAMIEAGATRIGTSTAANIIRETP